VNKGTILKYRYTWNLITTILVDYPKVQPHRIHSAGNNFCLCGDRILRRLRANGMLDYEYKEDKKIYDFSMTPKKLFNSLLKGAK